MSLLHLYKLAPCVTDMPYLLHEQDRKGTVNESPWKQGENLKLAPCVTDRPYLLHE